MKIIIFDSKQSRWGKKKDNGEIEYTGLYKALCSAALSKPLISGKTDKSFKETFTNDDIILLHETDIRNHLYNNAPMDLEGKEGPNIIKFSGGAASEATGENRERVFALEHPIEYPIFTKAETWKDILKYISDPKNQSKPACMGLSVQYISLRSQILTPFVALHLALQMNQEEQRSYLKNLSPEDRKFCNEGIEVLDNKGQELIRKFSELAGTPFEKEKALSQSQKDLNEFIEVYAERLSTIFQGIINNNQIELLTGVDVLLAGIEQLSKIVEDGIEKSDLIKKARVIKHDLDNVMRRLDNCISPLSPEKLEVIKGGMDRLDSIFKELNTLKESLHLDMQNELDSASELIRKIREGVKTNLEETRLLELRDELVSVLQKPFNMIVSITTGQEK